MKYLFLFYWGIWAIFCQTQKNATLKILVSNVEKGKGQLIVTVFNQKNGFPIKPALAFRTKKVKVRSLQPEIRFDSLPYGDYAVAVHYDENSDNKFNLNFLGIPTEKTGASNNPKVMFIPSFNDAKFSLRDSLLSLSIKLK